MARKEPSWWWQASPQPSTATETQCEVPAGAPGRPLSRGKRWFFRAAALTLVPAVLLLLLEGALQIGGYGHPSEFFVRVAGRDVYETNQQFGQRFFPPALVRAPVWYEMSATKPQGCYRIFVLGSSAAMGTPEPAFGFGRMLEAMLRIRYPETRFEVVNAAMTAINSHVVRPIARDCARHQPDLFIIYTGNNEFTGPYGPGTVFNSGSLSLPLLRGSIWANSTKTGQLLRDVLQWSGIRRDEWSSWQGMQMFLDHQVPPDDPCVETVYDHYRANLADVCDVAHHCRASVLLCTVATNLKDCPPFTSVHRSDLGASEQSRWEQLYAEGRRLTTCGRSAEAIEQFLLAAEIDDRFADLQFCLGRCCLALGQNAEARRRFVLARDLDAVRFRADTRINEIVREVGQQGAGDLRLVDVERSLAASDAARQAIPGEELFYEHVHLNPQGNYQVAKTLFDAMVPLLRDRIAQGPTAVAAPTESEVDQWIALSPWSRLRMFQDMAAMQERAPFTSQLDDGPRKQARQKQLRRLAAAGTSASVLRSARRTYEAALSRDRATGNFNCILRYCSSN